MKYTEILALLDRGLTPEQIIGLQSAPPPVPEQPAEPDPVPAQPVEPAADQVPEWAQQLNQSINRMTNALHANAIMNAQQPDVKPQTAEEALAQIIAPPPRAKK